MGTSESVNRAIPKVSNEPNQEDVVDKTREIKDEAVLLKKCSATSFSTLNVLGNANEFACEQCNFTTCRRKHLETHVNGVHHKIKDFQCEQCDYAAARTHTLKLHVLKVHARKNI